MEDHRQVQPEQLTGFTLPEATRRRILSDSFRALGAATLTLLFPRKLHAPPRTICRPELCRPNLLSRDTRCLPEIPCQPKLKPR